MAAFRVSSRIFIGTTVRATSAGRASSFVMSLPAQAHDASQNYEDVSFKMTLTMVKIPHFVFKVPTLPAWW
jgi:hypothetical protein